MRATGAPSSKSAAPWWLDPALAQLAFGAGSRGRGSAVAGVGDDRLDLDLDDPEQRALGEFELLELIGEGGMGLVYRARQNRLHREVAVKLLSAGPWASEDFISRFQEEARHAAQLQHPGIVAIHEMGELDGLVYYAMQLVRGESLAQRLQREGGRLPERQAAQLLRTIAEAVDYAHSLGVLHLDLKPANVLIDGEGQPKIADFGLARRLESEHDTLANEHIAGTPSYMAPEQASIGIAPLTRATDVWGLGAILYELLCGQPPFEAGDANSTLVLLRNGVVRKPSRIVPMSPDLEAICLKCLAKAPEDRYSSARALADDLGRFLEGRAVSVRPLSQSQQLVRWARRETRLAAALVLIAVSLCVGLIATGVQWLRAEQHAGEIREHLWAQRLDAAAAALAARAPLTALPLLADNLVEQEAAGAEAAAGNSRLRLAAALSQAPVLIDRIKVDAAAITSVAIDPDGQWLAAGGNETLSLYELPGGRLRWEIPMSPSRISLADDGRHLLLTGIESNFSGDFLRLPGDGFQVLVRLADGRIVGPEMRLGGEINATHFSTDGSHVLVGWQEQDGGAWRFHVREVASDRVIGQSWTPQRGTQLLAPRAAALAVAQFSGEVTGFRAERLELRDPRDFALRWRHHLEEGAGIRAWRFSPDARHLAVGYYSGQLLLFDVASGEGQELRPQAAASIHELDFSEDGGWLAAGSSDGGIRVFDVATRGLLVPPMQHGHRRNTLEISRNQRSLLAHGINSAQLWQLPETPGGVAEVPIGQFPAHAPHMVFSTSTGQGLLAAAGSDGELWLWRMRAAQSRQALAPVVPNAAPSAQGSTAVLAVRDRELRLLDQASGALSGPPLIHPQAVAFAAQVPGGRTVLSTAGPWLHGHDAVSGAARFAPVALPASPSSLLVAPDGDRVIVTYNRRDGLHNQIALAAFDVRDGGLVAETTLPGTFWQVCFSQRGDVVLAWRLNEVHLLAADTLAPVHPLLRFGIDVAAQRQLVFDDWLEEAPPAQLDVRAAALASDGRSLWLALGRGSDDGYQLRRLDLASGEETLSRPLPHFPQALEPLDEGRRAAVLIASRRVLLIYADNGDVRQIEIDGVHDGSRLAVSPDGRRLAVSVEHGVRVFDASDGQWLTPLLSLPIQADPGELTFDAAGEGMTLQAVNGMAWWLPLARETRSANELQAMARMLSPAAAGEPAPRPEPSASERARLRAYDPGAPRPVSVTAPYWDIDFPMAAPRFVDLRPACNRYFHDPPGHLFFGIHLTHVSVPGRQRLLGQDYELRCAVLAPWRPDSEPSVELGSRVEGIAVVPQQASAVHLLVAAVGGVRNHWLEEPYATLELAYADGSRERLAVRYRRDVWVVAAPIVDTTDAVVAYSALGATGTMWSRQIPLAAHLYAVRLDNPYPERELVALAWESVRAAHSHPLLLAATIEPIVP